MTWFQSFVRHVLEPPVTEALAVIKIRSVRAAGDTATRWRTAAASGGGHVRARRNQRLLGSRELL